MRHQLCNIINMRFIVNISICLLSVHILGNLLTVDAHPTIRCRRRVLSKQSLKLDQPSNVIPKPADCNTNCTSASKAVPLIPIKADKTSTIPGTTSATSTNARKLRQSNQKSATNVTTYVGNAGKVSSQTGQTSPNIAGTKKPAVPITKPNNKPVAPNIKLNNRTATAVPAPAPVPKKGQPSSPAPNTAFGKSKPVNPNPNPNPNNNGIAPGLKPNYQPAITVSPKGRVYNLPLEEGFPNWGTKVKVNNPEKLSFKNGEMTIRYKKDSHGSAGGIGIHASPFNLFPATEMRLMGEIYFPESFSLINTKVSKGKSGGKLPLGFRVGNGGASGGHWSRTGSSFRVTWNGNQKTGEQRAVPYLYYQVKDPENGQGSDQLDEFERIAQYSGRTGVRLFAKTPAPEACYLKKQQWNSIEIYMKLNTIGKYDGVLELIVNGVKVSYNKMRWRYDDAKINALMLSSFFGGSSSLWGPDQDTFLKLRNLRIVV